MQKLNYYKHKNLQNVEFSANEKYIMSYNGTVVENNDPENYIIWNVNEV